MGNNVPLEDDALFSTNSYSCENTMGKEVAVSESLY